MVESGINLFEVLETAKEVSQQNDQTIREVKQSEIDHRILSQRKAEQSQLAKPHRDEGNIPFAEYFENKVAKAEEAIQKTLEGLKAQAQELEENLREVPLVLENPADVVKTLQGKKTDMFISEEITRLEGLGFSRQDIELMAAGETQMRNHLQAKSEMLDLVLQQAQTRERIKQYDTGSGMKLEEWDQYNALVAEDQLYDTRLSSDRYKSEYGVFLENHKKAEEESIADFAQKQKSQTLQTQVDFSHLDRIREANRVAKLAKFM